MIARWRGVVTIPNDTMRVVAPAGGWTAFQTIMSAPVSASDTDAASTRGISTAAAIAEGWCSSPNSQSDP